MEKITNVNIAWANKSGQPYLDKSNRPFARVGIQTESQGKKWASGFAYQNDKSLLWKAGDLVDIVFEQKGQFLNWKFPQTKPNGVWTPERIEQLFVKLDRIEKKLDGLETVEPEPDIEPTPEELIPF